MILSLGCISTIASANDDVSFGLGNTTYVDDSDVSRQLIFLLNDEGCGINSAVSVGYVYGGIEGYIFPLHCPRPSGTVCLMQKYNPTLDDHAVFPETMYSTMASQGYTVTDGNGGYLGYVYPM